MKDKLSLAIRTPTHQLFSGVVQSIRAEDADGWVGIRVGRRDLILTLLPGLLTFQDSEGDAFVANGGGMLNLAKNECQVVLRSATFCRDVDQVTQHVEEERRLRQQSANQQSEVMNSLIAQALLAPPLQGLQE